MTPEDEIAALKQRMDTLEQGKLAKSEMQEFRGFLLNQSNYIRFERLPELYDSDGNLISSGGTPEITVAERFEWISPVNGTGTQVCAVDTGQDIDIIDVTETGHLTAIGVVCSKSTGSSGAADVWLDITIDNGTTQPFQLAFAARAWGTALQPFVAVGDVPDSGDVVGHALLIPVGLDYGTRLQVAWRSTVTTSFGADEWDLAATVLRGKKITA